MARDDVPNIDIERKLAFVSADENLVNADWTKGPWDLPAWIDTPEEVREYLKMRDMAVEHFKRLPVSQRNVDRIDWLQRL